MATHSFSNACMHAKSHYSSLPWRIPRREAWQATVHRVAQSDTSKATQHACMLSMHGLQPPRLLYPWNFAGKTTGVGCHFILQKIFLNQGSNPSLLHLLHWQADSLPLAPPGKPDSCLGKIHIFFFNMQVCGKQITRIFQKQN